jgi:glutathione S-transferase
MVYADFVTKEHGYVILASTGAFFVHMWLSFKVGAARKKYNVQYPEMYSDKEPAFNCVQRAHQNTLEGIPFYLSLLLTGGIRHPFVSLHVYSEVKFQSKHMLK